MNRFVFLIENLAQHTPDKIGSMLGSRWELVEFRGKSYACWEDGPRYLSPEEDPAGWESIRKYIVSVCDFLGNGQVYCTSDMFWNGLDDGRVEMWRGSGRDDLSVSVSFV